MKRVFILVPIALFLCSTANAFQGGGGESTKKGSTKKKAVTKKTSGPTSANTTPPKTTAAQPSVSAQPLETAVIDKFISKQESRESGYEYKDARKVIAGDLNRDGVPDLAVLYTIEGSGGGINWARLLAVFIRAKGKLIPVTHTVVGAKGIRGVELQSIRNNVIFLETFNYGPKDGACCPSKKGATRFVLVNGRLKERGGESYDKVFEKRQKA